MAGDFGTLEGPPRDRRTMPAPSTDQQKRATAVRAGNVAVAKGLKVHPPSQPYHRRLILGSPPNRKW